MGRRSMGSRCGLSKVIALIWAGNSPNISLMTVSTAHHGKIRGWGGGIAVPMIDVRTLGAGGGSIAQVDAGGVLPRGAASAGAESGAGLLRQRRHARHGHEHDLVLGFLDPDNFLAGKARLERHLAEQALHEHVATPLGLTTVEAAYGVHQVVSTTMAEGIRLLSVKRGVDPRDFALLAFGGASGLHVSRVARRFQIHAVLIPTAAPVLSAYGMLNTDLPVRFLAVLYCES